MKKNAIVQKGNDMPDILSCDRCGKQIPNDEEHHYELQETVSLHVHCGYGSKTWGDLNNVDCDLCEQCIHDLIADFARASRYA